MNEILMSLKNRKSVRLFEDRPLEPEVKEAILQGAMEAPTAGAMMLYTILDITDQTLKDRLAITCDHQPFIAKAPLVLIFLADYQRWVDAFTVADCQPRKPGEGDLLLAYADALIAAQNSVVAAESLGVGSCYIGDILENAEEVSSFLDLPPYVLPAAMVVYGYPQESQKLRKKPARFSAQYIVQENRYRKLTPEEHLAMHAQRHAAGGYPPKDVQADLQAFCLRKYHSAFAREMNRSAKVYLTPFLTEDQP